MNRGSRPPRTGGTNQGASGTGGTAKRTGGAAGPPASLPKLPPVGVAYHALLRLPGRPVWLGLAGIVLGVSLYTLAVTVLSQLVVGLGWSLGGSRGDFGKYFARAMAFEIPVGMLATNVAIAVLIPISMVLVAFIHRAKIAYLTSVLPGLRWRYLILAALAALVIFTSVLVISALADGESLRWSPQPGLGGFLVVVALTTPLQAAAEEVFFRGYLMQALGSLGRSGDQQASGLGRAVSSPWFAIVASALVFAAFHGLGQQNPALFLDRFGFGVVAGLLVVRTGGLEAGIAAHVMNNVMAWVLAGTTSSIAAVRATSEIGWIDAGFDVGGFALFALAAWWIGSKMRVHVTTE